MNLRQIEVFRAVMLAGSVTDAARSLHVSQPGISRMLSHIELQLGLRLFERRKGKLQATPEAQALFAEVEQVYRGVARIEDCAQALKSGKMLTLRVLCSPSTGLDMVPRALTALGREFPAARFYVEVLLARDMVKRLAANEADVAISTLAIDDPLLNARTIGQWTLAGVFPKGHALEARRTLKPSDILGERMIAFSPTRRRAASLPTGASSTAASPTRRPRCAPARPPAPWRRRARAWPSSTTSPRAAA
jgi:DNA-binding transcriptional LysR family regulator